jgi:hypothetical protein
MLTRSTRSTRSIRWIDSELQIKDDLPADTHFREV